MQTNGNVYAPASEESRKARERVENELARLGSDEVMTSVTAEFLRRVPEYQSTPLNNMRLADYARSLAPVGPSGQPIVSADILERAYYELAASEISQDDLRAAIQTLEKTGGR